MVSSNPITRCHVQLNFRQVLPKKREVAQGLVCVSTWQCPRSHWVFAAVLCNMPDLPALLLRASSTKSAPFAAHSPGGTALVSLKSVETKKGYLAIPIIGLHRSVGSFGR